MRVFLTGGTGFIGRPLTRQLLQRGWRVTALVRNPDSVAARAIQADGADVVPGDITDRASMRDTMTGADLVVHNAGWYELGVAVAARDAMRRINVIGTDNVLSLAQTLKIPRTVYVSSVLAYAPTGKTLRDEGHARNVAYPSFYARSKMDAHHIAAVYQQRGLPLIIACPGGVIGANDHAVWGYLARLYVNGWLPPFGWARDAIVVHAGVDDTAEGIALAAEKGRPGETYMVCGDPMTVGEVVAVWGSVPGRFRVLYLLPAPVMAALFFPLEPVQRWLGISAFFSRETVLMAAQDLAFSNAKARRELGWSPQPARDVWPAILTAERALIARRTGGGLAARLNPLDM